jgi:hypothetical protein
MTGQETYYFAQWSGTYWPKRPTYNIATISKFYRSKKMLYYALYRRRERLINYDGQIPATPICIWRIKLKHNG